MSRYAGKPFLRILECYILKSIDALPEPDAKKLEDMTPKLRELYGHAGEWWEIVAAKMDFPTDMPDKIQEIWKRNQILANSNKEDLHPEHFAQMFVDSNFVDKS